MIESGNNDENKDVKKGWFIAGIITISLAILLPFVIMIITGTSFSVSKLAALGAVGDFFGGSTIGLLSIASIFFIIHTIRIQSKELSLQREELKLTRDELVNTREVHEESNRTQHTQRFETTFFNMLSLQNELINNLEIKAGSQRTLKGREATAYLYKWFASSFRSPSEKIRVEIAKASTVQGKFYPVYEEFINEFSDYIEPYFRNIEIIIYLIGNSEFSEREKNHYLNIMKSQMSKSELKLLFYNAAFSMQFADSKELYIGVEFFSGYLESTDLIHVEHSKFLIL